MTKNEILEYFKDINLAYNECTRYDDLSSMIDKMLESIKEEIQNYNQFILCADGQRGIHIDEALKIVDKHFGKEEYR